MTRLFQYFLLVPALLALMGAASPLADPQVKEFLARERRAETVRMPSKRDLRSSTTRPLARRAESGYQPKHFRPVYDDHTERQMNDFIKRADLGAQIKPNGSEPEPVRGESGAPYLGPHNPPVDLENLDQVAGPPTDAGIVVNLKWSFGASHTRLLRGGWVREQTITDLPPSKDFAAAEIRLGPNSYRELHWHRVAEWGYILGGSGRIVAVDENGKQFAGDLLGPTKDREGDIYVFPVGVPHSIQAFDEGIEILLIFSDGNFDSLGTTFHLSDWLKHTPLEVLGQNFGVEPSNFEKIPSPNPYIFRSTKPPAPFGAAEKAPSDPQGTINDLIFVIADQDKQVAPGGGGYIKTQTAETNFPKSELFASNFVRIEPGGLRELHWNNFDEWIYILSGTGRATAFPGGSAARTFNFFPGDTGVFPVGWGHYIKNDSPDEPLIYLELWKAPKFVEYTATQWLSLMPEQHVADLLNITTDVVRQFKKEKQLILKGN